MNTVTRFLDRLWFPALAAGRLATIRMAVGLFAFWYVAERYTMFLKVAVDDPFYFHPVGAVWWMKVPLSPLTFEGLLIATLIANVAFVAGWYYRISGPAFGLLLLVLLSYRNSWTMLYHSDNAMVAHVLILGFVRAADVWSIDAWHRSGSRRSLADLVHWRYGWPVQLISGATVAGYLLSGIAKVMGEAGWNWVAGESLRGQVAVDAIRKSLLGESTSELGFVLYEHVWLFSLIGVVSLVVELGAPLALLNRRLGICWAINAFAMHWGIFFVMSITFRYQMLGIIFLSFFAAERIVPWLSEKLDRFRRSPEPATMNAVGGASR